MVGFAQYLLEQMKEMQTNQFEQMLNNAQMQHWGHDCLDSCRGVLCHRFRHDADDVPPARDCDRKRDLPEDVSDHRQSARNEDTQRFRDSTHKEEAWITEGVTSTEMLRRAF